MPNKTMTPYKNLPTELRAYVDSRDPSDKLLAAAAGWGLDKLARDPAPDAGPAQTMAAARLGADDAAAAFSGKRSQDVAAVLALRGISEPREGDGPLVHAAAAEREAQGSRRGRVRYGESGEQDSGRLAQAGAAKTVPVRAAEAPARKTGGAR